MIKNKKIPVIATTTYCDRDEVKELFNRCSIDIYFTKPFDPEMIVFKLKELFDSLVLK